MYFNTLEFFGFFILTLVFVRYSSKPGIMLLLASITFYVVAGWFDTALIATLVAVNWLLVRHITLGKSRLVLAVAINIGVLAAIKYRVFLTGGAAGDHTTFIGTVLPLGISFYTFQLLAYQIDAVRDPKLAERQLGPFALFIIFFPQLIAGPIVRAQQLLPQIRRLYDGRRRALRLYSYGLALCALGLSKKVIFADSLAPVVDDIFVLGPATMAQAWTGAWLFTFQIYFDFSGYSDIAIGSAYLLGIRLPQNFRTPYLSVSPREFWQRWHITLSTWIRDYLYVPLGGSQGPVTRQLSLLLLVMGIAGLWHGASTSFIVWGVLWGIYIGCHRILLAGVGRLPFLEQIVANTFVKVFLWGGHLIIIVCLWVFFRASNSAQAWDYLRIMFSGPLDFSQDAMLVLLGCIGLIGLHYLEARGIRVASVFSFRRWNRPIVWGFLTGFCLWLVVLPSYTENPFIYFRF
jgi:alginate O-acetyltransferase complex protein AlgI